MKPLGYPILRAFTAALTSRLTKNRFTGSVLGCRSDLRDPTEQSPGNSAMAGFEDFVKKDRTKTACKKYKNVKIFFA